MPSEKMVCECGCMFVKTYLKRHLETEKHAKMMLIVAKTEEMTTAQRHLYAIKSGDMDYETVNIKCLALEAAKNRLGQILQNGRDMNRPCSSDEPVSIEYSKYHKEWVYWNSIKRILDKKLNTVALGKVYYDETHNYFRD